MPGGMKTMLVFLLLSVLVVLGILITVAFMTLVERKLISPIQNRRGPNTVGYLGILQPFADALKLIIKESIFPRNARFVIFVVAPLISLFFALAA
jgi:NADH-ubiquinone oxidoreductase chain 1